MLCDDQRLVEACKGLLARQPGAFGTEELLALTENGVGYKKMYIDIGIMQKLTSRIENGERYYYSGAYTGDFQGFVWTINVDADLTYSATSIDGTVTSDGDWDTF